MDTTQPQPEQDQRPELLHTVQVGKRDVLGIVNWGPVHLWAPGQAYRLTWCGKRMKGLRSRGTRVDSVLRISRLCPGCSRALSTGQPRSYRGR